MERTLLHHCTLLRPEALSVQADGLVVFDHASPVDPPDCIGYAGPRCGPGAPSLTQPEAEDAVLDLEGTTLLPGFVDLCCALEDAGEGDAGMAALAAYRRAGNALNRGVTAIGCADSAASRAVERAGERYLLWTPCLVRGVPAAAEGYFIFRGAPASETPAEADYLAQVRAAKAQGLRPAVATGLAPEVLVDGLPPLVRAAQLLCAGGYAPLEAVAAVTSNNAALLGISGRTGALAAGMEGDAVAVEGDPLTDITALARVKMAARGGRLIWCHLKGFDRIRFALVPPGCPE